MNKTKLILLTPYMGPKDILEKNIISTIEQLDKDDLWIIVLDNENIDPYINIRKKYEQLIFMKYAGPRGAGNCRNMGLDYLIKNISGEFLLLPIDGDDCLVDNAVKIIKHKILNNTSDVITFGHKKIWTDGTVRIIKYSGTYKIRDLLLNFRTVLGATIIKVKNSEVLKYLRFGSRFRANDVLFFYSAVNYFGEFKCYPEIILNSKRGNTNSLSGKKYKMPFYRFLALRDFGLSNIVAFIYTLRYTVQGIRKYLFKHSI